MLKYSEIRKFWDTYEHVFILVTIPSEFDLYFYIVIWVLYL